MNKLVGPDARWTKVLAETIPSPIAGLIHRFPDRGT